MHIHIRLIGHPVTLFTQRQAMAQTLGLLYNGRVHEGYPRYRVGGSRETPQHNWHICPAGDAMVTFSDKEPQHVVLSVGPGLNGGANVLISPADRCRAWAVMAAYRFAGQIVQDSDRVTVEKVRK